jgi:hypothetical protein
MRVALQISGSPSPSSGRPANAGTRRCHRRDSLIIRQMPGPNIILVRCISLHKRVYTVNLSFWVMFTGLQLEDLGREWRNCVDWRNRIKLPLAHYIHNAFRISSSRSLKNSRPLSVSSTHELILFAGRLDGIDIAIIKYPPRAECQTEPQRMILFGPRNALIAPPHLPPRINDFLTPSVEGTRG